MKMRYQPIVRALLAASLVGFTAYGWSHDQDDRDNDGHGRGDVPNQPNACCAATGSQFPMVGGNYGNTRYSSLKQINTGNIQHVGAAWHDQLEGGAKAGNQQSTPVVVDGVIYIQTAQQDIFAVDGKTGAIKWKYTAGGTNFNL